MKIDFLKRSARCWRLEKNRNNVIREKMNIENSLLDCIKYRTVELVLPSANNDWRKATSKNVVMVSPGRRKWRPRNSWIHEVATGKREKIINNMEGIDRTENNGEGK